MDAEKNMEMSTLDPVLPRYYKGYDIDNIIHKIDNNELLTKEEELVYIKAWEKYHRARNEEIEKNNRRLSTYN